MTFEPVMDAQAVAAFIAAEFPQVNEGGPFYTVASVFAGGAVLRLEPSDRHLRPGGTVSGPTLFALADLAAYAAILAHIGPVALAVTTNLNINFMRKPAMKPLDGECRLLKLGKRLAVAEVTIRHPGEPEILAHATTTYSIPGGNSMR